MAKAFGWKLFHWLSYTLLASCRAIGVCLFGNCSSNVIMKLANKVSPFGGSINPHATQREHEFCLSPPKKGKEKFTPTQEEDNKACTHTFFNGTCKLGPFCSPYKTKVLLASFFPPYLPHFPGPICVVLEVPIHTFWCCPLHTLSIRGGQTHTFWCCPLHTLSPRGAHTHTFWCCPLHTLSPRVAHTHILVLPITHFEP
jgi:hypothetical protein